MAEPQAKTGIDEALTRRVADLARLELTDEEVKTFTHQLGGILKYVDQLLELDVSQVEPLTHPMEDRMAEEPSPLREDHVVIFPPDAEGKPRVLGSASAIQDGVLDDAFKVPQII